MADPIGHLLSRMAWGLIGYRAGKAREHDHDIVIREREHLRHQMQLERQRLRDEAARERAQLARERVQLTAQLARMNDERINAVANRVYARLFAKLSGTMVDATHPMFLGQKFPLRDLVGNPNLARFALEVADFVRKELKQQP